MLKHTVSPRVPGVPSDPGTPSSPLNVEHNINKMKPKEIYLFIYSI